VWVYFYLPEIKNRTLEEIDEMFEARLSARQFRKYVCIGRHVGGINEKVVRRGSSGSEKDEVVRQEVVGVEKTA
jgi:SP family sugar:H+ symporter-like MFS transporter